VVVTCLGGAGLFIAYLFLVNCRDPAGAAEMAKPQSMIAAQRLTAMNQLRDEDLVIGVVVNGKAKAYALSSVHAPTGMSTTVCSGTRPSPSLSATWPIACRCSRGRVPPSRWA
jgi:hypothetical protein